MQPDGGAGTGPPGEPLGPVPAGLVATRPQARFQLPACANSFARILKRQGVVALACQPEQRVIEREEFHPKGEIA